MKEKFINYYMKMAELTAELSYAKRLQVGAVIVKNQQVIGTGYNGTPAGWDNDCEYVVPEQEIVDGESRTIGYFPPQLKTKPEVLHSEMNALMKVARSTESSDGATLFCTHAPCIDCAKAIYQSGINSVYFRNHYRDDSGLKFLEKSGVSVTHHQ